MKQLAIAFATLILTAAAMTQTALAEEPAPQPETTGGVEKYDPAKVTIADPESAGFRLFFDFGAYLMTDGDLRPERRDDKVIAGGQVSLTGWIAVSQHFGVLARATVGVGNFAGSTGVPIRGGVGVGVRSLCDWYVGSLFVEGVSVRNSTNRTALTGLALRAEFAFKPGESYDSGVPQIVFGVGAVFGFNELGNFAPAFEAGVGVRWRFF